MSYNHVVPCHVASYDVTPLGATSCETIPYHVMSFDTCHIISCSRVISCHSISCQIISCHVIPTSLPLIRAIFFLFFLRWVDTSYKIKLSNIPLPTNEGRARKSSLPSSTRALRFVVRPTSFAPIPPFPSNACQACYVISQRD